MATEEQRGSASKAGAEDTTTAKSISAFVAGVFAQLSVTSWLPSVFFVGNSALLLALQGQSRLDLNAAIKALLNLGWGALILILFALTLSAIFIQAFEFEALRFLEGYYRSAVLGRWGRRCLRRQRTRRDMLEKRWAELRERAFDGACSVVLGRPGVTADQVMAWTVCGKVLKGLPLTKAERKYKRAAGALDWLREADAGHLYDWDMVELRLSEYPEGHRVLPTRLGNVMRASEDQLTLGDGEDLEGFMIRHLDHLPKAMVDEHDSYRQRIEMYCGMIFVLTALAVAVLVSLWPIPPSHWGWRLSIVLGYAIATRACYAAAIASALGFGQALREAGQWLEKYPNGVRTPNPTIPGVASPVSP